MVEMRRQQQHHINNATSPVPNIANCFHSPKLGAMPLLSQGICVSVVANPTLIATAKRRFMKSRRISVTDSGFVSVCSVAKTQGRLIMAVSLNTAVWLKY
jgi:hypothetical protein